MIVKDKKILVCGVARSGIAAARLLNASGALVTLQDIKSENELDGGMVGILKGEGIGFWLGASPDEIFENFSLIVISPGISYDSPFIKTAKTKGIKVIGEVELAYNFCKCPIAAITGTNGKTTTTALSGEIIKKHINGCEIVGNIGIPFTEKVLELKTEDYAVAEISSFQLESTEEFHAHIGAILNLSPDHIDRHGTFQNYIEVKKRVFNNQTCEDYKILNYDDELCRTIGKEGKGKNIFFSRKEKLQEGVFLDGDFIRLKLFETDEVILDVKELQIIGSHNYENALAAVAISFCAGVTTAEISDGLRNFKAVKHRIEFVTNKNGIDFYNDSKATNTDAAIRALDSINTPVVLIGGGYNKHENFTPWVKKFNGKVKFLILIGTTADEIAKICIENDFEDFYKVDSLAGAVELAASKAEKGDSVLLSPACASWDMFKSFEERGNLFIKYVGKLGELDG